MNHPLRVLVISDLFPNPSHPAFGIFVERQCHYLQDYCQQVVVAPVRVFPHLRIWKNILKPGEFARTWLEWRRGLNKIPSQGELNGLMVYYPRYTSLPKQIFLGTWGYFAYPAIALLLRRLYEQYHFDLIHAHFASPAGTIALLAQRWMRVPIVLSVHGYDLFYMTKQNKLNRDIIINVFNKVDAILANSNKTAQGIASYGIELSKIHLVRLGANPEIFIPDSTESATNHIEILSVGYLTKRKGHEFVLRAMADLMQRGYSLRYTIVGDGPEEAHLRKLTHQLDLDQYVSFEGYKPHDQVWSYFSHCDLFVLPSWNEAFGLVYVEALWMGKPVIGCQGEGGPEDLKTLGDCIELVKPRSVKSLVEAMERLINDPIRRKEMGEKGKYISQKYFSWSTTAEKTYQIYSTVVNKTG